MTISDRPVFSLRRYHATRVALYFHITTKRLTELRATTSGFYTSAGTGRNPTYVLATARLDGGDDLYRVEVIAALYPPLQELRAALLDSVRARSTARPSPSFKQFFEALSDRPPVEAHFHARFSYSTDENESVVALPSKPMTVGLPFDEIVGMRVVKLGEGDERLYEVSIDGSDPNIIGHEVIMESMINLNDNFILAVLKAASRISRTFIFKGAAGDE